ncbi:MAG: hypothetical protein M3Q07_03150 [Pseudobdellovibrionaceae bacterium]|nr:hypothetical protein [Pseudobdellovibrionaceae bacterium]
MKKALLLLLCLAAPLKAEVEIPVDGTMRIFSDDFASAVRGQFNYTTANFTWRGFCPDLSLGACGMSPSGRGPNSFISNFIAHPELNMLREPWSGGERDLTIKIDGRDPAKKYVIYATQRIKFLTAADYSQSPFPKSAGGSFYMSLECSDIMGWRLLEDRKFIQAPSIWVEGALNITYHLPPEFCPSNQFVLTAGAGAVFEQIYGDLELTILEEGAPL